jgi:uncharacterized membrane protein YeaQ/YmgE (transglycosylase-associated protein family)
MQYRAILPRYPQNVIVLYKLVQLSWFYNMSQEWIDSAVQQAATSRQHCVALDTAIQSHGKEIIVFNFIGMLIAGLVIGALARLIYFGPVDIGIWKTIALGIAGSFAGGLLTQLASKPKDGIRLHRAGLLMSIIGSILVLFVARRMGLW